MVGLRPISYFRVPDPPTWAMPFGRRRLGDAIWAMPFGRRAIWATGHSGDRSFGRRRLGDGPFGRCRLGDGPLWRYTISAIKYLKKREFCGVYSFRGELLTLSLLIIKRYTFELQESGNDLLSAIAASHSS